MINQDKKISELEKEINETKDILFRLLYTLCGDSLEEKDCNYIITGERED